VSVHAPAWFCDRLTPEIERFASVVDGADFATPVPSCGDEWTLDDLVRHIAFLHRWVEHMVRNLSQERVVRDQLGIAEPADPSGLPGFLREGAAPLVATLRASRPDAPMWAWGADKHARFWSRRMIHETTVHRTDAESALGHPSAVDPLVAADGVDEFLVNVPHAAYWSPAVSELKGTGETLALHAQDADVQWTITLVPEGFRWERGASTDRPRARVSGAAADVYLYLWNRRAIDDARLRVTGERTLAAWFQEKADL
jgi:uncharacterized protein (TIGR03083 family)